MIRHMAWFTPALTIALMCAAPDVSAQTADVFAGIDRTFEEFQRRSSSSATKAASHSI